MFCGQSGIGWFSGCGKYNKCQCCRVSNKRFCGTHLPAEQKNKRITFDAYKIRMNKSDGCDKERTREKNLRMTMAKRFSTSKKKKKCSSRMCCEMRFIIVRSARYAFSNELNRNANVTPSHIIREWQTTRRDAVNTNKKEGMSWVTTSPASKNRRIVNEAEHSDNEKKREAN